MKIITQQEQIVAAFERLNRDKDYWSAFPEILKSVYAARLDALNQLDPATCTVDQLHAVMGTDWVAGLPPVRVLKCDECGKRHDALVEFDETGVNRDTALCWDCLNTACYVAFA